MGLREAAAKCAMKCGELKMNEEARKRDEELGNSKLPTAGNFKGMRCASLAAGKIARNGRENDIGPGVQFERRRRAGLEMRPGVGRRGAAGWNWGQKPARISQL